MHPVTTTEKTEALRLAWRRGLTPPPRLTVVEWAERYRRLSKESSNGGKFRVSRLEVARWYGRAWEARRAVSRAFGAE